MSRRWSHFLSLTVAVALASAAIAQPPEGPPRGDGPRRGDGPPRGDGPRRGPGPPEGRRGFDGGFPPIPVLQTLDADNDGEISAEEISNAVAALKKLDKDKDGKLSREELMPDFAEMRRRGFGPPGDRGPEDRPRREGRGDGPPPEARAMMERILNADKNGDGKLSEEELPERMKSMMSRLDTNKDGFLDRAEIGQMLRQRAGQQDDRGEGARRRRGGDRDRDRDDDDDDDDDNDDNDDDDDDDGDDDDRDRGRERSDRPRRSGGDRPDEA